MEGGVSGVLSGPELDALLSALKVEGLSLDGVVGEFGRLFPREDVFLVFRVGTALCLLLEDNLLVPAQRFAALYVLATLYRDHHGGLNPFLPFFINALERASPLSTAERHLTCDLLLSPPTQLHVGDKSAAAALSEYRGRAADVATPDLDTLWRAFRSKVPAIPTDREAEVRAVIPDARGPVAAARKRFLVSTGLDYVPDVPAGVTESGLLGAMVASASLPPSLAGDGRRHSWPSGLPPSGSASASGTSGASGAPGSPASSSAPAGARGAGVGGLGGLGVALGGTVVSASSAASGGGSASSSASSSSSSSSSSSLSLPTPAVLDAVAGWPRTPLTSSEEIPRATAEAARACLRTGASDAELASALGGEDGSLGPWWSGWFAPRFARPAPPLLAFLDDEMGEGGAGWARAAPLLWDAGLGVDSDDEARVTALLARAVREPLTPTDQDALRELLERDPRMPAIAGLAPHQLPALVEKNAPVAVVCLRLLREARSPRLPEFLAALVNMELSLRSMEVVNQLTSADDMPPEFIHMYISNCIATCGGVEEKAHKHRLVRLVCVFLQTLIRHRKLRVDELFIEIQAFCVENSQIREAHALYGLLRSSDAGALAAPLPFDAEPQ